MDKGSLIRQVRQALAENNPQTNTLPPPADKKPTITISSIDSFPLANLPEKIANAVLPTLSPASAELFEQGARGPACRKLLAREIQLARIQLRVLEGMLNILLGNSGTGNRSERRLRTVGQLVHQAHSRMMAAIDQLARLDHSTPTIRIQADQAAVVLDGGRRA